MFNRSYLLVIALALVAFITGCAGPSGMVKVDEPITQNSNEATIVFMRSTFVGSAISASVFDVSQEGTKFLGIVRNDTKLAYQVPPGEHTFMVVAESADFMKATVLPNKTYYTMITPRMGVWRARFSFRPLRQQDLVSDDFTKWNSATQLVRKSPEAEQWAASNAADIESKRARYWPAWQSKDQEARDSQTLNANDAL